MWANIPYMGGMGIVSQQDFEMDDMKMLTPICPKQYPSTCFFGMYLWSQVSRRHYE